MPQFGNFLSGMRKGEFLPHDEQGHVMPPRVAQVFATKVLRMKRYDDKPGYGGVGGEPAPSMAAREVPRPDEAGGTGDDP